MLIFELRPGALADEGLVGALRKLAAAYSAREGIAIEVDAPAGGSRSMPPSRSISTG